MQKEISVPVTIEAVRKAGNLFLQDYKSNNIPVDKADLLRQLEGIDDRCLGRIVSPARLGFPLSRH